LPRHLRRPADEEDLHRARLARSARRRLPRADGVRALSAEGRRALALPRDGGAPGALPELEDVLAKHRGAEFEARLAELGPCRLRRTLRFVHCGIEGTDTTLFDATGRFREETDLAPFVTTSSSFDGERVVAESSLEG